MSQHNHMYNNHFIFSFNPESGRLLIVEKRALYYLNPQKKSMLSGFYIYFQLINYPALSKAEDKARLHSLKLSPILFKSELVLSDFSPSLLLCFTLRVHYLSLTSPSFQNMLQIYCWFYFYCISDCLVCGVILLCEWPWLCLEQIS